MNCRDVDEFLERMIFEEVPFDDDIKQHISACPSCSQAYRNALKSREVLTLVRNSVPVPEDPDEISDNIMFTIEQDTKGKAIVPVTIQRLLAAASIALFVLFGYEQYGVVKKISTLETKVYETRIESGYTDPQHLAMTYDINRAGISLSGIRKLIYGGNETRTQSVSLFAIK